jgi:hypothetical protein
MNIKGNNITTLAYIPLHYGADYLPAVLRSIKEVDTILILYTSRPSYGHRGNLPNPDSEELLRSICEPYSNLVWKDVTGVNKENTHRNMVYDWAERSKRSYDVIVAVDADEIWHAEKLKDAILETYNSSFHAHGVGGDCWYHFWKNHNEVNRDGFYPIRLFNLHNYIRNQTIIHTGEIYHMGYAISEEAMRYKLSCHGHKNEIANDWLENKWIRYERGVTTHLHPASQQIWLRTEDFNGKIPFI